MEHAYIAKLYAAYHSLTPREFFDKRGVLGQNFDTDRRECKTITVSVDYTTRQIRVISDQIYDLELRTGAANIHGG